jgi:hypothetical protein
MSTDKNQVPQCDKTDLSGSFSTECNQNFYTPKHSFRDGKYYRDEKYFGDVIYSDEKTIQVECNNGNKYMEAQIITMQLVMDSNRIGHNGLQIAEGGALYH